MFALAQSAGRQGFNVHATVRPMTSWAEQCTYINRCIEIPAISEVGEGMYAASLKANSINGVFLTCLDDIALFLSRHENILKKNGLRFITADIETHTLVKSLHQLNEVPGTLRIPKTTLLNSDEIHEDKHNLSYPLIVKSARNQFFVAEDKKSLTNFLADNALVTYENNTHRVQEYISGDTSKMATAMLLFDNQGKCVRGFTGRRTQVTQTLFGPFGETTAAKAEWIPELYEGAKDLLSYVGWKGFAEVECKQAADGHWYVMEINPRLSGWACLAEDDGAELLQAYYDLCTQGSTAKEVCLQRSETTYVRLTATLSHLPSWFIQQPSNWHRLKRIASLLHQYYSGETPLCLGAWDKKDIRASLSILWASIKNLWKY